MLKLELRNQEVYYNEVKVKINPQASKGQYQEVLDISKFPEANGKQWLSLNNFRDKITKEFLPDGEYEFECVAKVVEKKNKVVLTQEEQQEVNELQARIDAIYAEASKRQPAKPDFNANIDAMTQEELIAYARSIQAYKKSLMK